MTVGPEGERPKIHTEREQLKRFLSEGDRKVRINILKHTMKLHCVATLQSESKLSDKGVMATDLLDSLIGGYQEKPTGMERSEYALLCLNALGILNAYDTLFFNNVGAISSRRMFEDMKKIESELEQKK